MAAFGRHGVRRQATAGDRRRPQATAGERARAQRKGDPARMRGHKTTPRIIPATWGFASERGAAEMGEVSGERRRRIAATCELQGQWRLPTSRHRESRPRHNPTTRRGAVSGAARAAGPHNKRARSHPEKSRVALPVAVGIPTQVRPAERSILPPLSRDYDPCGIRSCHHPERPCTAHDPNRQSPLAVVPALRGANERARSSSRTKQTSEPRLPPKSPIARTHCESNRPRHSRERPHQSDLHNGWCGRSTREMLTFR